MASPQAKQVEIPLTRGIRQDVEATLMPPGGLVDALNVEFDKSARLRKRAGFRKLGVSTYAKSSTFAPPCQRTGMGAKGECVVFADADTHLYLPDEDAMCAAGQSGAGLTSTLRAQVLSRFNVGADQAGTILFADCAAITGHNNQTWTLVAYTEIDAQSGTYNCYVDLIDPKTGARALSSTIAGAGVSTTKAPRIVVVGKIALVLTNGGGNNIAYFKIDLSGATVTTAGPTTFISDGDGANTVFDAAPSQGGFVVAYRSDNGAGGKRCMVRTFDTTPTQLNVYNGVTGWLATDPAAGTFWSTPIMAVHGAASAGEKIVASAYDPSTGAMQFTAFLSTLASATTATQATSSAAQTVVSHVSTNGALALWSINHSTLASDPRGHVVPVFLDLSGGSIVKTVLPTYANYTIGTRLYRDASNNIFGFLRFNDPSPDSPLPNAQSHLLLVDWGTGNAVTTPPTPIAHVANGQSPLADDSAVVAAGGMADMGGGAFMAALPVNIGATTASGQQVGCWRCEAIGPRRFLNTVAQGTMLVAGGTPLSYDGQRLVELGFYSYPPVGVGCATIGGSGSMLAGTYQYRFTYEWTDAAGNRQMSPASPAIAVTTTSPAKGSVAFVVPTLHATRKQRTLVSGVTDTIAPVRVVAYRASGDGVFHRTGATGVNNTASTAAVALTDVNADTVTITGSDTATAVDTSANKTLLIRSTSTMAFISIVVTSGVATAKTTIVTDLNAAFATNALPFTASLTDTSKLVITSNGTYLELDTVAHGSTLNTAVGFPAGSSVVTGSVLSNEILRAPTLGGGNGSLPTSAPPPCPLLAVHNSRLWGLDAENPERIWCTKTFETGEAPGYNAALQVLVPGCGQLNGIAGQDDKLYGVATLGIYIATYGDGPDNTGATGLFASPVLITTAANCDDPRGVVAGDDGIYFTGQDQQTTTVYLIPRGNSSPTDIGGRIRTSLAATPQVRGAVYRAEKARIEFAFVDSDTAPTTGAIYYYHFNLPDEEQIGQWTRAAPSLGAPLTCLGDWSLTGSSRHTSAVGYVTTHVAVQDDATLTDPVGQRVGYTVQTGDIRPNGVLAYGDTYSASLLATSQSADDFVLSASYDSAQTFAESTDYAVAETAGPMLRRWESPTKKLPNGSVAYKIAENTTASGDVAGCVWHCIVLEAVPLGGTVRLPLGKMA